MFLTFFDADLLCMADGRTDGGFKASTWILCFSLLKAQDDSIDDVNFKGTLLYPIIEDI